MCGLFLLTIGDVCSTIINCKHSIPVPRGVSRPLVNTEIDIKLSNVNIGRWSLSAQHEEFPEECILWAAERKYLARLTNILSL